MFQFGVAGLGVVSGIFVTVGLVFITNIRNKEKENEKYLSSLERNHNIGIDNENINNGS